MFSFRKLHLFLFLIFAIGVGISFGQERDNQNKQNLPEGILENMAKRRIKAEDEDYQELIKRGEEAVKISEELAKKFEETNSLSNDDAKKIDRLEKVIKKIRRDLGAEEEKGVEEKSPGPLLETLNDIKSKASNLLVELKKTGKYSVSVVAIESSNAIVRLVRFLRFRKN